MKVLDEVSRLGTGSGRGHQGFCLKCSPGEERNDSYHICSLILLPSSSMVLILKSIPERKRGEKRHVTVSHFPSCI